MPGGTKTRAELVQVIYEAIGLSRQECAGMFEGFLKEITACLLDGETVKISNFGVFTVRQKGERVGRNPKTGVEVPIKPRRVVVFKPSDNLKADINRISDWAGRRDTT